MSAWMGRILLEMAWEGAEVTNAEYDFQDVSCTEGVSNQAGSSGRETTVAVA
jgi:hypothetical protein